MVCLFLTLFVLFRDENRQQKITESKLYMRVLYGCKTGETSRDWHTFQLPKDKQLRNTSKFHVENSVVLHTVKKFLALL